MPSKTTTEQIRALNDDCAAPDRRARRDHAGVAALGQAEVERIVKTIAVFDDFCQANDP